MLGEKVSFNPALNTYPLRVKVKQVKNNAFKLKYRGTENLPHSSNASTFVVSFYCIDDF